MKKLLILVFALGLSSSAQAQFGIRAGYSSANFTDFNSDAVSGFHAGAYFRKELGFLSVEPGVQYAQKGYKATIAPGTGERTEKMSYLDIPLLVRVNFLPYLNVFAGPQGSVLISRNLELPDGSTETSTEPIRGYDLAGVVGVGASIIGGINAQFSYDFGLQSVNYYDQNVKNNVFKISLGYDF